MIRYNYRSARSGSLGSPIYLRVGYLSRRTLRDHQVDLPSHGRTHWLFDDGICLQYAVPHGRNRLQSPLRFSAPKKRSRNVLNTLKVDELEQSRCLLSYWDGISSHSHGIFVETDTNPRIYVVKPIWKGSWDLLVRQATGENLLGTISTWAPQQDPSLLHPSLLSYPFITLLRGSTPISAVADPNILHIDPDGEVLIVVPVPTTPIINESRRPREDDPITQSFLVSSNRLSRNSKYFEAALSGRWKINSAESGLKKLVFPGFHP